MFQNLSNQLGIFFNNLINSLYTDIYNALEFYTPKVIWALIIIWIWVLISIWIYKLVVYLFKKFKLIDLIDKLYINLDLDLKKENNDEIKNWKVEKISDKIEKISDKIKIDIISAKAISYYIFLVFFRLSIVVIWIKEVENFMTDLLAYLPSLFIAIVIWFFWIRFADFVYDVVFHWLELTKQKTAKVIASWAKVIILFFTLMVVLDRIWIATEITYTILIGFVSMLAIAWGLAFWLWWKEVAHDILESFKK